jgi:hypothetical protein
MALADWRIVSPNYRYVFSADRVAELLVAEIP